MKNLSGLDRVARVKELMVQTRCKASLHDFKVSELREMLKGLESGLSKLKKDELVEALNRVLTQETYADPDIESQSIAYSLGEERDIECYVGVANELIKICETSPTTYNDRLTQYLTKQSIELSKKGYAATTLRKIDNSQRHHFRQEVVKTVSGLFWDNNTLVSEDESLEGLKHRLEVAYSMIHSHFSALYATDYETHKEKYKKRVLKSQSKQETLMWEDFEPILREGQKLVYDKLPKKTYWKGISLMLMLATGRRLNEVLSETTKFEVVDGELTFSGLSKGHSIDKVLTIPCLVDPQVVVDGFEWLRKFNKLEKLKDGESLRDMRHRLHNRCSKDIARYLHDFKGLNKTKCHDLRKVYAAICSQEFFDYDSAMTQAAYVGSILGHGSEDSDGDWIVDTSVAGVYQQYRVKGYAQRSIYAL